VTTGALHPAAVDPQTVAEVAEVAEVAGVAAAEEAVAVAVAVAVPPRMAGQQAAEAEGADRRRS
jgi:hypothetical protein